MDIIKKFLGMDESKRPPKEEAPSPAPENQGEQQQAEDEGLCLNPLFIITDKERLNYASGHLRQSFGVHNLDEILNTFAPDTMNTLNRAYKQANECVGQNNETHENQKKVYEWTKKLILKQQESINKQQDKIDSLESKIDALLNHFNVTVAEKKPREEDLTR